MKFIEFNNIPNNSVTIDVRTETEYANNGLLQYNIPIMNERDHRMMERLIIFALPIIAYKIYKNRHRIEREVERLLSENKGRELVIGVVGDD